jgi:hypothetical protein
MIDTELDAKEKAWIELVQWLRQDCGERGLTFNAISANEVVIRRGRRVLHVWFDLYAHRQLIYELEDGPQRPLQLVTDGDRAYFRGEGGVMYFRTCVLGAKMIDELLSLERT